MRRRDPRFWRDPARLDSDESTTRAIEPDPEPALTSSGGASRGGNLGIGQIVGGRYCIQEELAIGGMGRIYRAEQVPLGREVALKILDAEFSRRYPAFRNNFLLEAATCARIKHPNVVTVYDYGRLHESSDAFFMAMEMVDGECLHQVLLREGAQPWPRALRITYEIARALRAAHRIGAVHRDLKPANVMVVSTDEGESVKVLDFGLVKTIGDQPAAFSERCVMGSPPYMAPEQIRLQHVDGRADIYALGVILFRLLTGRLPFKGENDRATFDAHLKKLPPPLPPAIRDELPPGLEPLLYRCLKKDPADRWPDAESLIRALSHTYQRGVQTGQLTPSVPPDAARGITMTGPLPPVSVICSIPPGRVEITDSQAELSASIELARPTESAPDARRVPPWIALLIVISAAAAGALFAAATVRFGRRSPQVIPVVLDVKQDQHHRDQQQDPEGPRRAHSLEQIAP